MVVGVVAGGAGGGLRHGRRRSGPTGGRGARRGSGCRLGHGVKHVISLVFDNVHFARDNPNVPSDLEQMPHLLHFLENNGTVLSNVHTPMIAHTADDSLSIYTGLYGDRHGQPLTNSYKTYNPDGTTDPAASFAYWTSPVVDTASTPGARPRHAADDGLLADHAGRHRNTGRQTPAPWVPYTRAGCSVGNFSTANMVLENTRQDIGTVFGADSPEVAPARRRHRPVQGQRGRRLHRRRRALRARRTHLRARDRGQVRPDIADALGAPGPVAHRTRRLPRLPGAVRRPLRRPRSGAGHGGQDPQRLPGDQCRGEPRRSQRRRDGRPVHLARRVPASPVSTRPRRSRSPTSPTCRKPASR